MTDPEIADIISWCDEIIKLRLVVALYSATYLEGVSSLYSAYRVLLKDANARSLGEFSENRAVALQLMKDELDALLGTPGGIVPPLGGGVKVVATMEPI